jgi:hypothetical protein
MSSISLIKLYPLECPGDSLFCFYKTLLPGRKVSALNRSHVLLIVLIAFFCGFITAHLIQGYILNKGINFSIKISLAKPNTLIRTPALPSPEPATLAEPTRATSPQSAVPGISQETMENDPLPADGTICQIQKGQPAKEENKQSLGFQDDSTVLPQVASFRESVSVPHPDTTTGIPEAAFCSNEVAGAAPQKRIRSTKEEVSISGPKKERARALAPGAHHHHESVATEITTTSTTIQEPPPREPPVAGALPPQVVVQKGESLTKIITQYYPGQEKSGLEAAILANPEISREDVIHPGQVLNLPRINVSEQVLFLHDQRLYALYGSYYSAASWAGDKPWLEKNQVRFLVRVTRESTGRVIYRVFLGGYETAEDLKEAQHRLLTKWKRDRQEKDSESLGGSVSTTGQEEASSAAPPAKAASNSAKQAPAVENQPDPAPPAPAVVPEGTGETRLQADEIVAVQSPPEHRFSGSYPPMPLVQLRVFKKAAALLDWFVRRCRYVFGLLLFQYSLPDSREVIPKVGDSTRVWQKVPPLRNWETNCLEPSYKVWFPLSPSYGRYRDILRVLRINNNKHSPELFLEPIFPGDPPMIKTGPLPNTCEIQQNNAKAGHQDSKTVNEPGEQGPPMPLPEPGPPEKALPPGTIRRSWDAHGVLHIVNGELKKPNLRTTANPAESIKQSQPVENAVPQDLFPVKNVSWPGQDQNPLVPSGPHTLEKISSSVAEGTIRRYRDTKGVLHIVNVELKEPILATTTTLAENTERVTQGPKRLVKNVSFPFAQFPAIPLPNSSKRTLPPMIEGNIRGYRDERGFLHIENVISQGPDTTPPPKLTQPGKAREEVEIFGQDGKPVLPPQKASLHMRAWSTHPAIREISPWKGELLAESTVRRYRDKNGVLHIESVEYPTHERMPVPLLLTRAKQLSEVRSSPLAEQALAERAKDLSGPVASRVSAFRDRQGHLTICNREAKVQAAGVPPKERALAQLTPVLQEASLLYGLPVPLIRALIKVESNFVPQAVSPKGAMGLMQLMPATAAFLGVQDAFNPRENIRGGCRYLRLMLDYCGGSLPLALAAYNAGYRRVVSCGFQVPPIKETQEFVTEVMARYFLLIKQGMRPYGS